MPPISRDNQILFINHGQMIRHPSERKTPPPPKWGEDENEGYNPREPFYDKRKDPHTFSKSTRQIVTKREFKKPTKVLADQIDRPMPLDNNLAGMRYKNSVSLDVDQPPVGRANDLRNSFTLTDDVKK